MYIWEITLLLNDLNSGREARMSLISFREVAFLFFSPSREDDKDAALFSEISLLKWDNSILTTSAICSCFKEGQTESVEPSNREMLSEFDDEEEGWPPLSMTEFPDIDSLLPLLLSSKRSISIAWYVNSWRMGESGSNDLSSISTKGLAGPNDEKWDFSIPDCPTMSSRYPWQDRANSSAWRRKGMFCVFLVSVKYLKTGTPHPLEKCTSRRRNTLFRWANIN